MENTSEFLARVSEHMENMQPLFWLVFLVIFLIWVIYSSMLTYHWVMYGYENISIKVVSIIYFGGSIVLFAVAIFALVSM